MFKHTQITPTLKKVTVSHTHPAFSLAYLLALFAEAQELYGELQPNEVSVVSDGKLGGIAIEFFVQEHTDGKH